jgi:hypothetical protein
MDDKLSEKANEWIRSAPKWAKRSIYQERISCFGLLQLTDVAAQFRAHPRGRHSGDRGLPGSSCIGGVSFSRHRSARRPAQGDCFRKMIPDMAGMETELCQSDLEWTMVRPPRLTNGAATHSFRIADGKTPCRRNAHFASRCRWLHDRRG